jgi:hypothetical protein
MKHRISSNRRYTLAERRAVALRIAERKATMSEHTPGPWELQGSMNSTTMLIGRPGKWPIQYGEEIARVDVRRSPEHGGPHPVQYANACLIEAAPELLSALEELFGSNQNEMASRGLPIEWQPDSPMGRAQAAIRKARGEPTT